MKAERLAREPRVLLVGCVRGLTRESYAFVDILERTAPDRIGVALSPEELAGIAEYFADAEGETTVHLVETEKSEIHALTRWGEVRVPNPSAVRAIEWARAHGVPLHPLDPPDDGAASMFTANIGYVELVRRTLRERKLARQPPTASDPDEFALRWDAALAVGAGSRELARDRDRYLVGEVRRLLPGAARFVVMVDRERFDSVRARLDEPADAA